VCLLRKKQHVLFLKLDASLKTIVWKIFLISLFMFSVVTIVYCFFQILRILQVCTAFGSIFCVFFLWWC